ncbi:MAG TPA: hypothetical protein VEQ66_01070 [Propionibacteriaceae bacterium]|nr:hypothetical protein [Propionibacteriaceae bacterium]
MQFVTDVAPYELAKKRLLIASHCAPGYLGHLAGHRTSAEVMAESFVSDLHAAARALQARPRKAITHCLDASTRP